MKCLEKFYSKERYGDLEKLQVKTILFFNILFILLIGPMVIVRIFNAEFTFASLNGLIVSINVISVYLLNKGKLASATNLTCFAVTTFAFLLIYFKIANPYWIILPHFGLTVSLFLILFQNARSKKIYLVISLILLVPICISFNFSSLQTIPLMIQVFGFWLCFYFFSNILVKQDQNLKQVIKKLEDKNIAQEELNTLLEEKNKELKTMSYIMSHDLKAPIGTINSFIGLIKRKTNFEDKSTEKYFNFIESSTIQMNQIIDDLLIFQKININTLAFDNIPFIEIMEPITSMYLFEIERKKLNITIGKIPDIDGNKVLLDTLFRNLISNGLKYQPKDKTHVPSILIEGKEIGDKIEIHVIDNGIGIKDEFKGDIFMPFKRLHSANEYSGTGLGLSICKRVMEKHNGQISLYKSGPTGTTFSLIFKKSYS